jgi:RNA polymerase sigma factor (sigma-70 family)
VERIGALDPETPVLPTARSAGDADPPAGFAEFVAAREPALRRALVAAFGPEVGRDAAAEALARAWQHWDRVSRMANPAGYVFRIGRNAARRRLWREARGRTLESAHAPVATTGAPAGEPGLAAALERLSERQRRAVLLVHGYGYTLSEAATAMGCSPSTVRNHLQRGLSRLRSDLGVEEEVIDDA